MYMYSVAEQSGCHLQTAFFCHGFPGSPADARLLAAANPDARITALELLKFGPKASDQAFLDALDSAGAGSTSGGAHLVGFSIGAMAAIKIAASRPDEVSRLTLVSPAAPLQLGEFLPDMAGRSLFRLAIDRPGALAPVTAVQASIATLSPGLMTRILFGRCGPSERALLQSQSFRKALEDAFHMSFIEYRRAYLGYLRDYVEDWSDVLAKLECPVDLWHGTADTWSPREMSVALKDRLGHDCTLHEISGAEHYSTLMQTRLTSG